MIAGEMRVTEICFSYIGATTEDLRDVNLKEKLHPMHFAETIEKALRTGHSHPQYSLWIRVERQFDVACHQIII